MQSRLFLLLKTLRQLGFTQVALYGLYKLGLKTGYYKRVENRGLDTSHLLSNDLFSLPDRTRLIQTLGEDGQRALLVEADEIVGGKVRMFGGEPVELILTYEDPLHHWAAYETGKVPVRESRFPIHDIKYIWEPARFGWAFVLGRAYHLTCNETYAEAFWKYFEDFTKANPPCLGPHWMNGQEVAIRVMALVWAGQVFETAASTSRERRERLAASVTEHAARIPPTLIYARAQNNNHLLCEATGLYTAALALPDLPMAGRWKQLGFKWLDWCFSHQIDDIGEYIQHSTNYQRLMLQLALWIASIAEDRPRFIHNERLASAARWLASLTDPVSGQPTNLGANDGAYIFPLANGDFRDFRPVVQAASRLFLGADAFASGVWDEMSLWFGCTDSKARKDADDVLPKYPILRSDNSWGMLRAAGGNLRLAHADLLHVDLWWHGLNIALDPGTYLYNDEPPWNNPWPATRYHNTVTINQADQMTRAGRFLYLDWAKVDWGYGADINRGEQEIHASHNGYHKFGLWHHRILTQAKNRWQVLDHIYPSGTKATLPFNARLHWLLPDWEWDVEIRDQGVVIGLKSPQGRVLLVLQTAPQFSNLYTLVSLVRAGAVVYGTRDARPTEGWFSPTYGIKAPALSLAVEIKTISEAFLTTEFIFPA